MFPISLDPVFPHEAPSLCLCPSTALGIISPGVPATPFLFLIFQRGQVCGIGILAIGLNSLAPALVLHITQAQTRFPRSALDTHPAAPWVAPYTCPPLHRDSQGGCMLKEILMSPHRYWCPGTAPLASQRSISRELLGAGLSNSGFLQPALEYRVYNSFLWFQHFKLPLEEKAKQIVPGPGATHLWQLVVPGQSPLLC